MRFKAPQPVKPWDGVRSAKEFGSVCYQFDIVVTKQVIGTEDCLYLNVYTPDIKPKKPLPVMFWIHGGGLICGSGNDDFYGPDYLIRHDVVVVTINYRVGILGFLCLDTEEIPGNAGMKDQVAALRWVKKNIVNFGGDPDNITIFGESAGSASASYHLMSPMTKGLLKRAILQSGVSTCGWSYTYQPRERAILLAKKLGFDSKNDKDLVKFFKNQPVESLVNVNVPLTFAEETKAYFEIQFSVVSEKKFGDNEIFFSGDVFDILRHGIHDGVDVIIGFTADEGLLNLGTINDLDKIITQANYFLEYFVPKPIAYNCSIIDQLKAGRKIKKFYFKDENVSTEHWEQLVKYFSVYMFLYGIIQWQKLYSSTTNNKLYSYQFSCKSERNLMSHVFGLTKIIGNKPVTCHGDDLPYFFSMKLLEQKVDVNSRTFKMIENVTKLWTNFAKFGNPTPDNSFGLTWTPYDVEKQIILNIDENLTLITEPNKDDIDF